MDYTELIELIDAEQGEKVDVGQVRWAPTEARITRYEELLGRPLPDSYKWFVRKYAVATIFGDPLFTIHEKGVELEMMEDIAFQYGWYLNSNFTAPHEIPVLSTDFGELFLLDSSVARPANEYPVIRGAGEDRYPYADNFVAFLLKFIRDAEA